MPFTAGSRIIMLSKKDLTRSHVRSVDYFGNGKVLPKTVAHCRSIQIIIFLIGRLCDFFVFYMHRERYNSDVFFSRPLLCPMCLQDGCSGRAHLIYAFSKSKYALRAAWRDWFGVDHSQSYLHLQSCFKKKKKSSCVHDGYFWWEPLPRELGSGDREPKKFQIEKWDEALHMGHNSVHNHCTTCVSRHRHNPFALEVAFL